MVLTWSYPFQQSPTTTFLRYLWENFSDCWKQQQQQQQQQQTRSQFPKPCMPFITIKVIYQIKIKLLCKSTMSYLFSSATDQSSGWCWWAALAYALLLTNGDQKWSLKWKARVQVEKPCTSGTQHTPLLHCSLFHFSENWHSIQITYTIICPCALRDLLFIKKWWMNMCVCDCEWEREGGREGERERDLCIKIN